MIPMSYVLNEDFEEIKARVVAQVHPRRMQTLRICVHDHPARETGFDLVAAAQDYVSFLQLRADQIPFFRRLPRGVLERVCATIAEFELIMSGRQMPRETAATLSSAWSAQFDERAAFLVNGDVVVSAPPVSYFDGFGYSLFFTDREAGVIGLASTRSGLFWSAENS